MSAIVYKPPPSLYNVQSLYPAAQERIAFQLKSLRDAGIALTLLTIRALMIAVITDMAPEVYEVQAKDGSCFKCSESFVRA